MIALCSTAIRLRRRCLEDEELQGVEDIDEDGCEVAACGRAFVEAGAASKLEHIDEHTVVVALVDVGNRAAPALG